METEKLSIDMKLRVDLSYRNTLPAIQITFETRTNNHKLAQNEKNPLAQTDARLLCGRLWVLSIALKNRSVSQDNFFSTHMRPQYPIRDGSSMIGFTSLIWYCLISWSFGMTFDGGKTAFLQRREGVLSFI